MDAKDVMNPLQQGGKQSSDTWELLKELDEAMSLPSNGKCRLHAIEITSGLIDTTNAWPTGCIGITVSFRSWCATIQLGAQKMRGTLYNKRGNSPVRPGNCGRFLMKQRPQHQVKMSIRCNGNEGPINIHNQCMTNLMHRYNGHFLEFMGDHLLMMAKKVMNPLQQEGKQSLETWELLKKLDEAMSLPSSGKCQVDAIVLTSGLIDTTNAWPTGFISIVVSFRSLCVIL